MCKAPWPLPSEKIISGTNRRTPMDGSHATTAYSTFEGSSVGTSSILPRGPVCSSEISAVESWSKVTHPVLGAVPGAKSGVLLKTGRSVPDLGDCSFEKTIYALNVDPSLALSLPEARGS